MVVIYSATGHWGDSVALPTPRMQNFTLDGRELVFHPHVRFSVSLKLILKFDCEAQLEARGQMN